MKIWQFQISTTDHIRLALQEFQEPEKLNNSQQYTVMIALSKFFTWITREDSK